MQQFEQYDLLPSFWRLCEQHFGYTDVKPTLERLLVTLFVTYTARYVQAELPAAWKSFVSYKAGNIIAFLDSLMNSVLYRDKYDELSDHVAKGLNVYQAFSGCRADDLVECDTFLAVDQVLVKWLMGRLLAEDTGAKLNELTIPEVCESVPRCTLAERLTRPTSCCKAPTAWCRRQTIAAPRTSKPLWTGICPQIIR